MLVERSDSMLGADALPDSTVWIPDFSGDHILVAVFVFSLFVPYLHSHR